MSKLFVQVERVEDLMGRADNYFGYDLCGKDSVDATAFACAAKPKPITNYDLLVRKTPEKLAEYIHVFSPGICPPVNCRGEDCCYECWLDWLKQEVK